MGRDDVQTMRRHRYRAEGGAEVVVEDSWWKYSGFIPPATIEYSLSLYEDRKCVLTYVCSEDA